MIIIVLIMAKKVSDEVVLSVKKCYSSGLIENVSFDLHKGEILGFGGLSESGMHEIGKAVFGASYDREGAVTLADGTQINSIPIAIKKTVLHIHLRIVIMNQLSLTRVSEITFAFRHWMSWQENHIF